MISKTKQIVCIALLFSMMAPYMAFAKAPSVYEVIMERIREDLSKSVLITNKAANKAFETLQKDGSWKEVNYEDQSITNWAPNDHLANQQALILSYITEGSIFYQNAVVYDGIVNTFKYWINKDPKSGNWWHNEIGAPQLIGESLILMRFGKSKLPADVEQTLVKMMTKGDPYAKTGANKTDIALHFFYRSLLTKDKALIESSVEQLFYPVKLVDGEEGLQYDNSYLQHGPQLQISSYGHVFIIGVLKLAKYVKDTPYALSADKVKLFSNYFRNSYLKVIRGQYIDFNVEGRGVSRKNILEKKNEKYRIRAAKDLDPANSGEWDAAIARTEGSQNPSYQIKPSNSFYWKADYMTHIRPAYSFNVRIASTRTKRSEAGNKENLLGTYLSDGATNIQVNGPEYFNIMPIWEWDKIPGVTSRDNVTDKEMTKFWGEEGHNDFAGGVSNNVYGASAYQLNYDSVSAKKAWFFFDKEIVCLGTDISSNTAGNITTTVDQKWLTGKVESATESLGTAINKNLFSNDNTNWILHNSVGYYFPSGGNVNISTAKQEGNWYQINNNFPKDNISGNVFKLWFNHGAKPANATYSYIVLPGATKKDITGFKPSVINIVENSSKVQAVYHHALKLAQIVFYEAGSVNLPSLSVTVDKPCILMLTAVGTAKMTVSVADPLQKEAAVNVNLKELATGKAKEVMLSLPQKEMAGATVSSVVVF
jgi:chondroitin AC lyase